MSQLPNAILAVSVRVRASSMKAARAKLACHLRRLVRIPYSTDTEVITDDFLVQDSEVALTRSWYPLPSTKSFIRLAPDSPPDRHVMLNLQVNVSRRTLSETTDAIKSEIDLLAESIEHEDLLGQQGGRDTADIFWEIFDPTGLSNESSPEQASEEAFQKGLDKLAELRQELTEDIQQAAGVPSEKKLVEHYNKANALIRSLVPNWDVPAVD